METHLSDLLGAVDSCRPVRETLGNNFPKRPFNGPLAHMVFCDSNNEICWLSAVSPL